MKDQKPELLSPAGSFRSICAAVEAGADAVYASGKQFGARAYAENLNKTELTEAIDYVHLHKRKLYLTINTLLKDQEMDELFNYLQPVYEQGLDAVIVQDVGVFYFLRQEFPDLPVHISTQMTITDAEGVSFFAGQGASRIILARELSLEEIRQIRQEIDNETTVSSVELEYFIHGALCYCYSGQCLLSSMIGGRSGNRGQCAQPCRLNYAAKGQKNESLLSMKDLCTLTYLPELVDAGIDSFKIEGRMKQPDYVYTVTSIYRKYLDLYTELRKSGKTREAYQVRQKDLDKLKAAYQRRGYTEGYLFSHNGRDMISFERPGLKKKTEKNPENSNVKYAINATHLQEKINGKLMLSAGSRATLYLECGENSVTCYGDLVESAKNQPLLPDQVDRQMRKTGGTPFVFQNLKLTISDDVFLPVQALNRLRRQGLKALQDEILSRFLRIPVSKAETITQNTTIISAAPDKPKLSVLVSTNEQLMTVTTAESVSRIYVNPEIGFQKETLSLVTGCRKEIYLAMPYVFRANTREKFDSLYETVMTCYDGVLVRSWDAYAWLMSRRYQAAIEADQNLYVFNRESIRFFEHIGIKDWTAPAELNMHELRELGIENQTLVVYGYQPVMISANCVKNTTTGCLRDSRISKPAQSDGEWLTLTDESHHSFAVKSVCPFCYNLIYNGVPLALLDEARNIFLLHPGSVRLDFTRESGRETEKLIEKYAEKFLKGTISSDKRTENKPAVSSHKFTRGHFTRGVT